MKCTKNCILLASGIVGAMIAFVSASMAICFFEEKADLYYLMKRKAKKAIKQVENKIDEKLNWKVYSVGAVVLRIGAITPIAIWI